MPSQSNGTDTKKITMLAVALLCLAAAGYMIYRNFSEPAPAPPLPQAPEDLKTSEPAPLPPNVNRPKPG